MKMHIPRMIAKMVHDTAGADKHRGLLAHDAMAAMSISMLDRAVADPRHISTA